MSEASCPSCGRGELRPEVVHEYEARLGGVAFPVRNAEMERCTRCGKIVVSAAELRRWKELQREHLARVGFVPGPEQVRALRETLGLPVRAFAALMGVTRQTVHAWERPNGPGQHLGPASLLLGLLIAEASGAFEGVFRHLHMEAARRGQLVLDSPPSITGEGGPTPPHARRSPPRVAPAVPRRARGTPSFRKPGGQTA